MSDPGQDDMEDVIKEEKIMEYANEIDDGRFQTWKEENESDLEKEFIEDKVSDFKDNIMKEFSLEFQDFCMERFNEVNE